MRRVIGRTLSEYRILEKLGEGGMGEVFLAEDIQLQHKVALKFLSRDLTGDQTAKERFLQEARAAIALDHPNICTIHGIGEAEDGRLFIVMAYYEGETLKERLSRGPLSYDEARSILLQTARGLAHAHARRVVHRDIKPANIMITSDGVVKILDFGLARLADQSLTTRPGQTLGTIAYMSPEQARGEAIDQLTDIWSCGVVLYEMLAGERPFKGEYSEVVIYSLLNLEPTDPSALRPEIPEDLAAVCRRCLQKDRTQRPQRMEELLAALGESGGISMPAVAASVRRLVSPRRLVAAAFLIALGLFLWRYFIEHRGSDAQESLIAILPFRNLTGDSAANGWAQSLQSIVEHDFKHLGIYAYDINSLNGYLVSAFGDVTARPDNDGNTMLKSRGIRFLVDGNIAKGSGGYTLQMEVQDLVAPGFDQTRPVAFADETSLQHSVVQLIPQVNGFLHLKQLSAEKEKDLEPWVSRRPQSMEAHKALMEAMPYIYRFERGGRKFLERAIELDSLFFTPRVWLISSLVSRGSPAEALPQYAFLKRHEPEADGFDQAMIDWCGAYIDNDEEAQIRHLRTALEYSPGNNILLYTLARLTYLRNDWAETRRLLEPVVAMKWSFSPAYFFMGSSLMRLGEYDEARRVLEQCLEVSESVWPDIYGFLSTLAVRRGDPARARHFDTLFLREALKRGDSSWQTYGNLAGIYSEEGFSTDAIRYYLTALQVHPGVAEYHDSLATLFYRTGNPDRSKEEWDIVQRLDPGSTDPFFYRGRISERRGDTAAALAEYRRYMMKDSATTRGEEVRQRMNALRPK